jgi:hypothetical protein
MSELPIWERITTVHADEIIEIGPARAMRQKVEPRMVKGRPVAEMPGAPGSNESGKAWRLASGRIVIAVQELVENGEPKVGDFFVITAAREAWMPRDLFLQNHRKTEPEKPAKAA